MNLSLITVTYNSAATVRDTMESVLAQSYPDVEYIVKDGGSTDGTVEICREYEERFRGRMRIISSPDAGIYDAMNQGITAATGEVVGFLNSDDVLADNGAVGRQMRQLEEEGADAVYSDVVYRTKDLKREVRYYSSAAFRPWKMRFGWMPAHPTFYCRKAIYEKYGAYSLDYKVAADYECLLRLLVKNGARAVYNPGVTVVMREGGISNNGFKSHWLIMKDHLKACKENGIYSNALLQCLRFPSKVMDLLRTRMRGMMAAW